MLILRRATSYYKGQGRFTFLFPGQYFAVMIMLDFVIIKTEYTAVKRKFRKLRFPEATEFYL